MPKHMDSIRNTNKGMGNIQVRDWVRSPMMDKTIETSISRVQFVDINKRVGERALGAGLANSIRLMTDRTMNR